MPLRHLIASLAAAIACCFAQDTPALEERFLVTTTVIATATTYVLASHTSLPVVTVTTYVTATTYVLASPTSLYSTTSCGSNGCRSDGMSQPWTNSTSGLETISLTSSGTSTITNVVTPPDVNTTSYLTPSSSSQSSSSPAPPVSSISTSVVDSSTSTTTPVITITVYPVEATTTFTNNNMVSLGPPPQNFASAQDTTISAAFGLGPAVITSVGGTGVLLRGPRPSFMAHVQNMTSPSAESGNSAVGSRHSTHSATSGSFPTAASAAGRFGPHGVFKLLTRILSMASLGVVRAAPEMQGQAGLRGRSWAIFSAPMGDEPPVASGVVFNGHARDEVPDPRLSMNSDDEPTTTIIQTSMAPTSTYTLVGTIPPTSVTSDTISKSSTVTHLSTDMVAMTIDNANDPRLTSSSLRLPDTTTFISLDSTTTRSVPRLLTTGYQPQIPGLAQPSPTSTLTNTETTTVAVTIPGPDPNDPGLATPTPPTASDTTLPADPSTLKTPMPISVDPSCTWPSPNIIPGCISQSPPVTNPDATTATSTNVLTTTFATTTVTNMLTSTSIETMSPLPPTTVTVTAPPVTMTTTQMVTTTQAPSFTGPATSANANDGVRVTETASALMLIGFMTVILY